MHIHAQSKSESDVKVDPVVKWIWSKVAITKSYHKCYQKCYHKVYLGANACMHGWIWAKRERRTAWSSHKYLVRTQTLGHHTNTRSSHKPKNDRRNRPQPTKEQERGDTQSKAKAVQLPRMEKLERSGWVEVNFDLYLKLARMVQLFSLQGGKRV